jgi:hypothetical protein
MCRSGRAVLVRRWTALPMRIPPRPLAQGDGYSNTPSEIDRILEDFDGLSLMGNPDLDLDIRNNSVACGLTHEEPFAFGLAAPKEGLEPLGNPSKPRLEDPRSGIGTTSKIDYIHSAGNPEHILSMARTKFLSIYILPAIPSTH